MTSISYPPHIDVRLDDLRSQVIADFLQQHLEDMRSVSPPESKHALDLDGLRQQGIYFYTMWSEIQWSDKRWVDNRSEHVKKQGSKQGEKHQSENRLIGCGAFKILSATDAEIKSMRIDNLYRGQGLAALMLEHIEAQAMQKGIKQLWLETGTMAFFAPARRLYLSKGFKECDPFADYTLDDNSIFMTKSL
ncbi:GNAT family N-acetyltransferase [Thalassotalea sp. Y01]|uniref:GNAT family N-acetyltransferase n=1 Tax=Thalassotalea sp. Y01 TaxID=2729613 RepID=UPI00145E18EE|nr:GNAT family N-acetyltransferase [Thalassotalea sp. Y01]NMP15359.1 GNAT family N-acetyltransferase [Thalassotalea sp. Y01]